MNEAERARENAISFEVKKDGLQQRQSGDWVLRVTVAAIDMHQVIVNAPMGAGENSEYPLRTMGMMRILASALLRGIAAENMLISRVP